MVSPSQPHDSHYFSAQPSSASAPRQVRLHLPDLDVELETDRGVFSHDAVDRGTEVLLRHGPAPPATGHLLDLGCGYGAITVALARRAPEATVHAIDVNTRALELCRRNAAAAGCDNVAVSLPGDVDAALRFDAIWSNPPIRIGRAQLLPLLQEWLERLTPEGSAHLVVQRHLGADSLADRLRERGFEVERAASHAGYRLLTARRAAPSRHDPGHA